MRVRAMEEEVMGDHLDAATTIIDLCDGIRLSANQCS